MVQNNVMRVELQIAQNSELVNAYQTIGDLKQAFPDLQFVKYIYLDPKDKKLKGINPPNQTPIVSEAYITVAGNLEDIIKFAKLASK